MLRSYILTISIFILSTVVLAQGLNINKTINYSDIYGASINGTEVQKIFHPKKGYWNYTTSLPYFTISVQTNSKDNSFVLSSYNEVPLSKSELSCIKVSDKIYSDYLFNVNYTESEGIKTAIISANSIRRSSDNIFYKLTSFNGDLIYSTSVMQKSGFLNSSVLNSGGIWYKIGILNDGVYKLDYSFLLSNGIISGNIQSDEINIFGNGKGLLNSLNGSERYDDLSINNVYINDGGDGIFSNGDYLLFYGLGPHINSPSQTGYNHTYHIYSDTSYYFININGSNLPSRLINSISTTDPATHILNTFQSCKFFEQDKVNLLKSGSNWYGDIFDVQTSFSYDFSFPNLSSDSAFIKSVLIGKSPVNSTSFIVSTVNSSITLGVNSSGTGYYSPAGKIVSGTLGFTPTLTDNIDVNITYNKNGSYSSKAYLDYLEVCAERQLIISEKDMLIYSPKSVGLGNIAEFNISNASNLDMIWEVTDNNAVKNISFTELQGSASFKVSYDSLRKFVCVSGNNFPVPHFIENVIAQDLHALNFADLIIISPEQFLIEAQELKLFHENEGLSVHLVTPKQIYNEFSSGIPDVTAIKQFLRMFYVRSNGNPNLMTKYCLLFGDGTYDNKNILGHGKNHILVYESTESLSVTGTYASDDYMAILFDGGSISNTDQLNIAIGRMPINTKQEASEMLQKIKNYSTNSNSSIATCSNGSSSSVFRDWRNIVTMISDDEDNNAYFNDVEIMANKIEQSNPEMNIVKIHSDAYAQEVTPVGERIPEASNGIKNKVESGSLLVNYIGHGGETGWAHEQILTNATINSWTNYNRLPVFMTATCEFSRFDDHGRTSAGELVLLNPDGGGIGLFTTTRLVYATPNEWLNRCFYDTVFDKINNMPQTMGDIYLATKNKFAITNGDPNYRKFALLGDPAIRLSLPEYKIVMDSINGFTSSSYNDTIKALSKVRVSGHIEDLNGQILTSYNGTLYNKIFDKISSLSTLGTNSNSYVASFPMWKNVIYKGKTSLNNGYFNFDFIVPQDISFQYGNARFSFYCEDANNDANGYDNSIKIGGIDTNAPNDNDGPTIELYINDEGFVSGGSTDENPKLFAKIFDENGINTVGNGIGHNIEACLDNNTSESIFLNDYYESDLDTYKSGEITYSFSDLEAGSHTLTLKVWDVYNNSSKVEIEFVVYNEEEIKLSHVLNYPNPFTTKTDFFFEHNQICNYLDVSIQIFTISGKLIRTINKRAHSEGFRSEGISWNGRDDFNDKLAPGVYIYTLKVTNERSESIEKTDKLVILNY